MTATAENVYSFKLQELKITRSEGLTSEEVALIEAGGQGVLACSANAEFRLCAPDYPKDGLTEGVKNALTYQLGDQTLGYCVIVVSGGPSYEEWAIPEDDEDGDPRYEFAFGYFPK